MSQFIDFLMPDILIIIENNSSIFHILDDNNNDNFFSPASQRSGILNPWIWLGNRARCSGPDFTIRTPSADRSEIFNFSNF